MQASYPSQPPPVTAGLKEDWDILYQAVLVRLRAIVAPDTVAEPVRDGVLDCVYALERLQETRPLA